jgi:toxin ParE1/3/4
MSLELLIRPEAREDLSAAFAYYESCMAGLGDQFLDSIKATLDVVVNQPELYPKVFGVVHRALIHRFPFGVFYLVTESQLVVAACLHVRRSPSVWKSRVH